MNRRFAVLTAVLGMASGASALYFAVRTARAESAGNPETSFESLVCVGVSLATAVLA